MLPNAHSLSQQENVIRRSHIAIDSARRFNAVKYEKLIKRWDTERKLIYDDIVHVLQSTIDSRNLNDKLKVSNAEIHFTRESVNLVTHILASPLYSVCVIEADFWSLSSMLDEPIMS